MGCSGWKQEIKEVTDISLMQAIHLSNDLEDKMDIIIYQKMMDMDAIDSEMAQDIVTHYRWNTLCLGNVKAISPEVANILAGFWWMVLILPSLEDIDEETADNLSQYEWDIIVPRTIEHLLESKQQLKKEIIREI